MEKYDKIKHEKEKTNRFAKVLLLLTTAIGSVFVIYQQSSTTSGDSSSLLRQVPLLSSLTDTITGVKNEMQKQQQQNDRKLLDQLTQLVKDLDGQVRAIKETGVIMETDPTSLQKTKLLKDATRELIITKYGNHTSYRVKIDLEFQRTIPDYDSKGPNGTIILEMAPILYQPVSVYNFLEISRTFTSGAFNRNAGHVLQTWTTSTAVKNSLAFQEYSKEFPHKTGTTGYAGRPSGPDWYISIQDNTENHGPGSQQDKNPYEADSNFGTVVEGFLDVVPRIHTVPQRGFLDKKNQVKIIRQTILVPDTSNNGVESGTFVPWVDWTQN